jgi:hypothetical protein
MMLISTKQGLAARQNRPAPRKKIPYIVEKFKGLEIAIKIERPKRAPPGKVSARIHDEGAVVQRYIVEGDPHRATALAVLVPILRG